MITSLYIFPLTIILLYLLFSVIKIRRGEKISLGDGGNEQLTRAVRAHGNFIEIVPYALIILFLMEYQGVPAWGLHCFGIVLVLSRIAHAKSILCANCPFRFRMFGMLSTLLLYAAGAITLCVTAVMAMI